MPKACPYIIYKNSVVFDFDTTLFFICGRDRSRPYKLDCRLDVEAVYSDAADATFCEHEVDIHVEAVFRDLKLDAVGSTIQTRRVALVFCSVDVIDFYAYNTVPIGVLI